VGHYGNIISICVVSLFAKLPADPTAEQDYQSPQNAYNKFLCQLLQGLSAKTGKEVRARINPKHLAKAGCSFSG
jgi:hypothetical protein